MKKLYFGGFMIDVVYVINVAQATDRLARISARFSRLGWPMTRSEATTPDRITLPFFRPPHAEKSTAAACAQSHFELWQRVLAQLGH
jgi:GR25 family glycosyltransferase involved in LPS biosynthesis